MASRADGMIVRATLYIREVCDEIIAVSKVLEERFRQPQLLPPEFVADEFSTWPSQSPGNRFFQTFGCWMNLYKRRPKRSFYGCAAYLFDLGGKNTYATLKGEAVVLVGWTGENTDENVYDVPNLETVLSEHVPFGEHLFVYSHEDGKPHTDPADQSWCYAVPLLSVRSEDDAERLLIKPVVKIAVAPKLNASVAKEAFKEAREVIRNSSSSK